jgi:hypothetical protein
MNGIIAACTNHSGDERDPGGARRRGVACMRLPSSNACRLPRPMVTKAKAGEERILGGRAQAVVTSTGSESRDAAGVQALPHWNWPTISIASNHVGPELQPRNLVVGHHQSQRASSLSETSGANL